MPRRQAPKAKAANSARKKFQRKPENVDKAPTPKQQLFIEQYLIDLDATKAALRVGYLGNDIGTTAYRLKNLPHIKKEIEARMKDRVERLEIDQDWVVRRLREVSDRCMQAVPVLAKDGSPVLVENAAGQMVPSYTFDSGGATRSTELLGKHVGMFREKVEHFGSVQFIVEK